jgi:probable rRNA maturation factor
VDVFVANEQDRPIDEARLSALTRHALKSEDVDEDIEISVLLVTADHIHQLNARYAGADHATDVLAFPMIEDEEDDTVLLGDVVICPAIAQKNAASLGHGLERELDTLVVHGTLHLLGYDHQGKEDTARMQRRLREILDSFG